MSLSDLIPAIQQTRMPSTAPDAKARKRARTNKWRKDHMPHILAYQKRRKEAIKAGTWR